MWICHHSNMLAKTFYGYSTDNDAHDGEKEYHTHGFYSPGMHLVDVISIRRKSRCINRDNHIELFIFHFFALAFAHRSSTQNVWFFPMRISHFS